MTCTCSRQVGRVELRGFPGWGDFFLVARDLAAVDEAERREPAGTFGPEHSTPLSETH